MKTQNAILGIGAVALALGSAFASVNVDNIERSFISIQYEGEPLVCVQVEEECNNFSGYFCKIIVNGTLTAQVYGSPSCVNAKYGEHLYPPIILAEGVVEVLNREDL
ncbi:hypothetical protein KK083_31720 [Fulvivirgaceae bacterium PWU4]|uniref:Uncharacterized protein n=1 Tax=Chryseosolibacter histidini TaxID=2782349 RepID=A0AAP2DVI7_9BACT|nr:DUF6520 family protein [Chryseosolibacter histidini]MBT1701504.1 hypothetical protein [Chryseosolibacter histidini]